MSTEIYPNGIDCVWLASDREGYLGAFVTGGVGPVPLQALNHEGTSVQDIEGLICGMPSVSGARTLVSIKRPDDFLDLAERGIFVYDWIDFHRTASESLHAYEQVATPVSPITVDMLPDELAGIAKILRFDDVAFVDAQRLDVRAYMNC
ncbi:MAG: hypothetical protein ACT4PZ_23220 [Panacagrimonas sp.]